MPHLTQYSVNASPWREDSFSAGTPLSACSPSAFCRAETRRVQKTRRKMRSCLEAFQEKDGS